ncbi:MAG: Flp pilus assembly protein CpaB [Alphaproteobacteria bacterium]|nr:Flp pilus assembly protein CpaB [Alphaproteobacteria bacterium]
MALLVVFAVVAAGVTFFLAKTWIDSQRDAIRRQAESMKPATTESVNILVAKENLPAGLLIQREHVEWTPWPEKGAAKTFLMEGRNKIDEILGAVVRTGIIAGEPIAKGRVLQPGDQGFLAAVLKPDMRAISIRTKDHSSVAGYIKPGDYVDLLVAHSVTPATADPPTPHDIAETFLKDIRVVAIDQTTNDQSGKASVSKTITLEVTPKQAEVVTVAKNIGAVSLVLRSMARPDAKPNQIAKKREPKSRTWDSEVSRVLPSVGGPKNQLTVIRGVEEQNVGIPAFGGQGGTIAIIRQGTSATTTTGPNAGAAAARVITP